MLPLSAGFESYLQLFTLGLHQAKENAAQGIRAFFFENRLNNERPIANVSAALKGVDPGASTEEMVRFALRAMVMKG